MPNRGDDLRRCLAFLREHAFAVSTPGASGRFGTALLQDEMPRVWSANYVLAEQELDHATAEELAAEADDLLGREGLNHRKIEVWDAAAGERLAEGFAELGWHAERDIVMAYRARPDRDVDTSAVEEVEADALVETWIEGMRAGFQADEDVLNQLVAYKQLLVDRANARFFAARADGTFASYCDLYSNGGDVAQVEAVVTLERFRKRGLARAVVTRAREASEAAGHELTFLLADAADWPKDLYEKLGFVTVGAVYDFTRRASPV